MDRRSFIKKAGALGGSSLFIKKVSPLTGSYSEAKTSYPVFWKLAPTPPMGWNSYDNYGRSIIESEYLANAEVMQNKLLPYGYNYTVIDYLWFDPYLAPKGLVVNMPPAIDQYGRFLPAVNKFPSAEGADGFKPLSEKIHDLGLKFGIHILRGIPKIAVEKNTPIENSPYHARDAFYPTKTLHWQAWDDNMYGLRGDTPAGQAYYDSLARLYARWGVQFIKVDDLSRPYHEDELHAIRRALDKFAPDIVLSTSPGKTPVDKGFDISQNANMWRISTDFWDKWEKLDQAFDLLNSWKGFGGPGHWPDCDMLCLGHIGLRIFGGPRLTQFTMDEQRTLMTLWSLAPSPLIIGSNLTRLDPWTLSLITNTEVLAVNQDKLGEQGLRIKKNGPFEVWAKDLADGSKAVGLFNRGGKNGSVVLVEWSDLKIKGKQVIRDLWEQSTLGAFTHSFRTPVPGHGVVYVRITPVNT